MGFSAYLYTCICDINSVFQSKIGRKRIHIKHTSFANNSNKANKVRQNEVLKLMLYIKNSLKQVSDNSFNAD